MRIPQILIAEDDVTLQRLLAKALQSLDCHITTLEDGADVLQYLGGGLPDLVLLDLGLPNVDGRVIMQYIRRNDLRQQTKVIMMTGNQQAKNSTEAKMADIFLLKPISIHDLKQAAEVLLESAG